MSSYGRTIRIYLADGSPTGIKHAELVNWTGQALVCPRGRVGELSKWPESQRPGVYVLFGEDTTGTKALAYIGEAENVLVRLQSHIKGKEFWDQVVLFTSKDENLTKAHVKYLEARMVEAAMEAGRVALENGTSPQLPSLPRADRDAMEEFLDPARILLAALGFPLLQPVVKKSTSNCESETGASGPLAGVRLHFDLPKRNVKAEGSSTDEGFVVFAGSLGDRKVRDSLSQGWRDLREELIAEGKVEVLEKQIRFLKDVLFKSPSAAAAVTAGGVWNGRAGWKDANGKTLKDLEEALLEGPDDPQQAEEPATP